MKRFIKITGKSWKTIALALAVVATGCNNENVVVPKEAFTVTFNSNGGSEVVAQTVKANEKATEPSPAPTLEGYVFVGWYTDDQTFTNRWNFEVDAVISDITLYAKWKEEKTYTVTFNSNGGSELAAQTVKVNGKASEPEPAPTHDKGFLFAGWYAHNHSYNTGYNNCWDFETNIVTADTTLYAKWKPIETIDVDECDKSLFSIWNGDPGIPYANYADFPFQYLWDDNLSTMYHTIDPMEVGALIPPKAISFDMGKTYTLTHFRIWHRAGATWAFFHHNPKIFRIYGSIHPNVRKAYDNSDNPAHQTQKWILLGEFDTVKPSGLPSGWNSGQNTEEDLKAAHIDGIEYVLPVELAAPVRYFRMDVPETWGKTNGIHMAEMSFWGISDN